jgi:hypothetical protein
MTPLTQGLLIGFLGSGLYFAVDRYEPDRTVAFMLKFLVVLWAAAAVFHCTGLFGYGDAQMTLWLLESNLRRLEDHKDRLRANQ